MNANPASRQLTFGTLKAASTKQANARTKQIIETDGLMLFTFRCFLYRKPIINHLQDVVDLLICKSEVQLT